jgi:hypothetical protein
MPQAMSAIKMEVFSVGALGDKIGQFGEQVVPTVEK